eukprot:CAMPEP_0182869490 /NCGR_PEP_ID=MMETSP0034_2-20130328/9974_1 /TAXON_ID=156128 /ORGANISM="Nephroselmis pyriformis, Strain CCMP717" /LENGTH=93 /DNA_ID=CAMNT_0025001951 /DNA_START=1 /DNA_END=278 /DNA_ORIENTATION=-
MRVLIPKGPPVVMGGGGPCQREVQVGGAPPRPWAAPGSSGESVEVYGDSDDDNGDSVREPREEVDLGGGTEISLCPDKPEEAAAKNVTAAGLV